MLIDDLSRREARQPLHRQPEQSGGHRHVSEPAADQSAGDRVNRSQHIQREARREQIFRAGNTTVAQQPPRESKPPDCASIRKLVATANGSGFRLSHHLLVSRSSEFSKTTTSIGGNLFLYVI
jgi:hypothetical protein